MTDEYKYYLVGNYVYQCYEEKTGGIDFYGNRDMFLFILGWAIKDSYPEAFDLISLELITRELSV